MRIFALLLIFLAGMTRVMAAPVQESWYFAQNTTDGQVIAYTAEGETKILLEGLTERGYGYPLDSQSALGVFNINGTPGLYHLTPDSAVEIPLPYDLSTLENELWITETQLPYVVLQHIGDEPFVTDVLVNLETHTAELFSPIPVYLGSSMMSFSEDGQYLRFSRDAAGSNSIKEIVEYTIATGSERIVYTSPEDRFARLTTDEYGEHWLYSSATDPVIFLLINIDGTVQELAREDAINGRFMGLFEDNIYASPLNCLENCTVEIFPLSDDPARTYTVPTSAGFVVPVQESESGHLITYDLYNGALVSVAPDGTATPLGYWNSRNIHTNLQETFSPDGRWLLVSQSEENPAAYALWDIQNQEFALEKPFVSYNSVEVIYGEGGVLLEEYTEYNYLFRDGTLIELPGGDNGIYYDALRDGTVLYWQYEATATQFAGLYRYDPATETFTLLVENGELLTD